MSELPDTWLLTNLGAVVDYGKTLKIEPDQISAHTWVLELEDIEKDTSRVVARLTQVERQSKSTKNRFDTGDVLYGKLRPYLNKVVIADAPGCCTTEIIPLRAGTQLDNRYLFYWLKHPDFLTHVEAASHGMSMPRLGTEAGKAAPFVLAPRNEQARIAEKLDAVLARVDACRDRIDHIPAILKRFRQSILAAAMSGKLTEEWRVDMKIAFDDWTEIPLDEVCIKITDGEHISPALTPSGAPLVSAKDVREWGVDFSDTKFVSAEFSGVSRRRCNPELDDVLVVSRGATVGRTCLITSDKEFCLMGSVLLFKPAVDMVNPRYLAAFLRSPLGLERLTGASGASAQSAIYIRDAKKLLISMPHKEEQIEIVRRVESLFAFADRLEARYTTARNRVEKLTQSLLAKAFRGELVPQDPSDEPATRLLARIPALSTGKTRSKTTIKDEG